jgi:hypothetical protein
MEIISRNPHRIEFRYEVNSEFSERTRERIAVEIEEGELMEEV